MASKSRSGLTKEEREKFLRSHGFMPVRSGKGSHQLWEHPELKLLARSHHISPPDNLMSKRSQQPWETTLCADPGGGTWHGMVKHAKWCQGTVEQIKASSEHEVQRCKIVRQFREAVESTCRWKKNVKKHLRAGLKAAEAPKAPIGHDELQSLKNRLSAPSA